MVELDSLPHANDFRKKSIENFFRSFCYAFRIEITYGSIHRKRLLPLALGGDITSLGIWSSIDAAEWNEERVVETSRLLLPCDRTDIHICIYTRAVCLMWRERERLFRAHTKCGYRCRIVCTYSRQSYRSRCVVFSSDSLNILLLCILSAARVRTVGSLLPRVLCRVVLFLLAFSHCLSASLFQLTAM